MNILLTAFEPFGGNTTNITQKVIMALPKQIGEHLLHKLVLPVSFQRAPIALREAIEQQRPDFVLMLGQCGEGEQIRLERYAHNMMDSQMGDNDHYCPTEEIIYQESHCALMATTPRPLRTLSKALQDEGCPVTISTSAGLYVCNRVYYEALYLGQKALFVHVPKNIDKRLAAKTINFLVQNLHISKKSCTFAVY